MDFNNKNDDPFEEMHDHLVKYLLQFLDNDDIQGLEISSLVRIVANLYSAVIFQDNKSGDLSGPRMGILFRLIVAEEKGLTQGINPTQLSHAQHVKKNTISSLLRGLEENGLIERNPDPNDKRGYLIKITQTGKDMIKRTGPYRLKLMNDLASGLTPDEKKQLIQLLGKLRKSIKDTESYKIRQPSECPLNE